MNKVHRIIWDEARGCFVVTHEKAASRGRRSSARRTSVRAIAAAAMALGSGHALAIVTYCNTGQYTIGAGTTSSSSCAIGSGENLVVEGGSPGGAIVTSSVVAARVLAGTVAGSISNAGRIVATATSAITISGAIGSITNSGSIGGSVNGIAVTPGTLTGGLTNSGTLSGGTNALAYGGGTIAGGVTNSGLMTGARGIYASSGGRLSGGITNSGTIAGSSYGMSLSTNSSLSGGITNSGSLSGGNFGYAILMGTGAAVSGGIVNTGRMSVNSAVGGGVLQLGGTVDSISNTGTIVPEDIGSAVSVTGAVGLIDNAGTMVGASRAGVSVTGTVSGITNSGLIATTLAGTATGTIAGIEVGRYPYGTVAGSVGRIVNHGTISADSTSASVAGVVGIRVNEAGITDGISNSGMILATVTNGDGSGIGAEGGGTIAGGVTNSGWIVGQTYGVSVTDGSLISGGVTNAGTIGGGLSGVFVDATSTIAGDISNSGAILGALAGTWAGTVSGIAVAGKVTRIVNSGLIEAGTTPGASSVSGAFAIQVSSTGTITDGITNSGLLTASGVDIFNGGIGIEAGGSVGGGITNSGTVGGMLAVSMIDGGTIGGGITNTGTIGGAFAGIVMTNGATISGALGNSGVIAGTLAGVIAFYGSTISGGITNSGTIAGTVAAILIDETSVVPVIRNLAGGLIDGAILSGNGATQVTNAGTIAMPAGTTSTIAGNYVQEATGMLRTRVADDVTYGKLSVSGTVVLPSNARIDVDVTTPAHAFTVSELPDVIAAGTLVSDGTFAVTDNSALFDFSAVKDGNTVDLLIAAAGRRGVENAVLANGNTPATGAAQVLDRSFANNPTGPIAQLFTGLTNQQQVSDAAAQVLPLLTGGSLQTGSAVLANLQRMIQSRIDYNQGRSSGESFFGDRNFWLRPFGSWAEQGERQGVAGFRANVAGLAAGLDAALNERLRLGVAFAYANAGVDSKSTVAPQHMDTDVHQLIGYGSYAIDDRTEASFQADIGHNRNRGTRTITFAPAVASASYDSLTLHAGAGFARTYPLAPDTRFIPSLRLDYTTMKDRAYSETGAGALNLGVDGRRVDQLLASFDARLVHSLSDRMTLGLNAGGGYDWLAERTSITATFAGEPGAAFTTYGNDPRPWVGRGGAGLTYRTQAGLEVTVRYDLEYRSDYLNQTASAKLRWNF